MKKLMKEPVGYLGCGVTKALSQLDTEDCKELKEALDNPAVMASSISRTLRDAGFLVSGNTVRVHRRQDCMCVKLKKDESA